MDSDWVSLDEIFATSDVVSLHCPLTPDTRLLVNAARLVQMKPSAILINTARGLLVDEQDLADALNTGRIAGAGLDILTKELSDRRQPAPHRAQLRYHPAYRLGHEGSPEAPAGHHL